MYTTTTLTCRVCTRDFEAGYKIAEGEPTEGLCPHCSRAIGTLHQNPELDWIKVLQVDLPGNVVRMMMIRSDNEELLRELEDGPTLRHADTWAADKVDAIVDEEEDLLQLTGQGARLVEEGIDDFAVTRDHYDDLDLNSL